MQMAKPVGARLGLSGTLEFRDKAGNVLKTVDFVGSVPLDDTGLGVWPGWRCWGDCYLYSGV